MRYAYVTGVQTCALPIFRELRLLLFVLELHPKILGGAQECRGVLRDSKGHSGCDALIVRLRAIRSEWPSLDRSGPHAAPEGSCPPVSSTSTIQPRSRDRK